MLPHYMFVCLQCANGQLRPVQLPLQLLVLCNILPWHRRLLALGRVLALNIGRKTATNLTQSLENQPRQRKNRVTREGKRSHSDTHTHTYQQYRYPRPFLTVSRESCDCIKPLPFKLDPSIPLLLIYLTMFMRSETTIAAWSALSPAVTSWLAPRSAPPYDATLDFSGATVTESSSSRSSSLMDSSGRRLPDLWLRRDVFRIFSCNSWIFYKSKRDDVTYQILR